jgi:hypothetical protein
MLEIETIYQENLKLIKEESLKVGSVLKLKEDFQGFKKGRLFKISFIHSVYGWILFEETEQFPQRVKSILKILRKCR